MEKTGAIQDGVTPAEDIDDKTSEQLAANHPTQRMAEASQTTKQACCGGKCKTESPKK